MQRNITLQCLALALLALCAAVSAQNSASSTQAAAASSSAPASSESATASPSASGSASQSASGSASGSGSITSTGSVNASSSASSSSTTPTTYPIATVPTTGYLAGTAVAPVPAGGSGVQGTEAMGPNDSHVVSAAQMLRAPLAAVSASILAVGVGAWVLL